MTPERIADKIIEWFDGEWPPLRRLRVPRRDYEMFQAIWNGLKAEGLIRLDDRIAEGVTRTQRYSAKRVYALAARLDAGKEEKR